ncbi:MAG TPA: hypothetical protein VM243_18945 [Phycisphaerae bacterium]|nr:hypothetical protein [Phycisphaerae bacterium]
MGRQLTAVLCVAAVVAAMTLPGTLAAAETLFESFEGNFGPWRPNAYMPRLWHVTPSRAVAFDGIWSLDFTADGLSDDGTVWMVRELALPAGTWTIGLEFTVSTLPGILNQWPALGFIGLWEPLVETDFTQTPEGQNFGGIMGDGSRTYSMERTLQVSSDTTAYVAFGYTITWETVRTHYFDSVTLTGVPVQCGNDKCSSGENPCNCAVDCGAPAGSETLCDDGLDDDCDGYVDCVDSECKDDPACAGIVCDGDWVCETEEHSCYCWMDCDPPPVMETSCSNELDDDCDGMTDCDDLLECTFSPDCMSTGCDMDGVCEVDEDCINCPTDCIRGGGTICGNGVCEPAGGEDCVSCPGDCNGNQGGAVKKQFCCGDGDGVNPIGCDDSRCTSEGFACSSDPAPTYCCGDGFCEGAEDGFNCAIDCGAPPVCGDTNCDPGEDQCNCLGDCGTPPGTETVCDDGIDNDCDGPADCADADCTGDPACPLCDNDGVCETDEDCVTCPNDCDGRLDGPAKKQFCCGNGVLEGPEGDGSICDGNP